MSALKNNGHSKMFYKRYTSKQNQIVQSTCSFAAFSNKLQTVTYHFSHESSHELCHKQLYETQSSDYCLRRTLSWKYVESKKSRWNHKILKKRLCSSIFNITAKVAIDFVNTQLYLKVYLHYLRECLHQLTAVTLCPDLYPWEFCRQNDILQNHQGHKGIQSRYFR